MFSSSSRKARRFGLDRFRHETVANSAREDEGERAALDLLVLAHGLDDVVRAGVETGDVGNSRRQADRAQMRLDPIRSGRRAKPQSRREAERRGHADGDALAMHQPRAIVMVEPLQRMAEGVAKVQKRAVAALDIRRGRQWRPWPGSSSRSHGCGRPPPEKTPRQLASSQAKKLRRR